MLQADVADSFVLATNRSETVREFVNIAFKAVDITLEWKGVQENEYGIDVVTGKTIVRVNPQFRRPTEVELLVGSAKKARDVLGWKSTTSLETLCQLMVARDIERVKSGKLF